MSHTYFQGVGTGFQKCRDMFLWRRDRFPWRRDRLYIAGTGFLGTGILHGIGTGLSDVGNGEQQLTFLYENPETGSWTIAFYSLKNHQTCVIMAGQSSTHIVSKLKGSKS